MPLLPTHLNQKNPVGWNDSTSVSQYLVGPYQNFNYIILDQQTHQAAIVDPQIEIEPLLSDLKQHNYQLKQIWLTHTHYDHVGGLQKLYHQFKDLQLYLHSKEYHRIEHLNLPKKNRFFFNDNESFSLGQLEIKTSHTPGHTAGALCFQWKHNDHHFLLSGDTLFLGNCGRTDLPTGNVGELFNSLSRIKTWNPNLIVLCGHHYSNKVAEFLGNEIQTNPALLCKNVEELTLYRLKRDQLRNDK
ncbi:MAG: hypothetical protein CL678_05205 [Bdellovibrionaceae bacterium]|nr:hypothetical protein [Pseudobdellovibrionaceae bacterium]|tara:strand:+ start:4302 stop:5033 length:732 start_codon:yes stop_codon:yes gene_type:complete